MLLAREQLRQKDEELALQRLSLDSQNHALGIQVAALRLQSVRDAANRNLAAGGTVVALTGIVLQFAEGRAERIVGAAGAGLALAAFVGVVWFWRQVAAPHPLGENDRVRIDAKARGAGQPLARQTGWLAVELFLIAATLIATLATAAAPA